MKKNLTKNTKSNIMLALFFSAVVLSAVGNVVVGKKDSMARKEAEKEMYKNYEFISANVVSDVTMKKDTPNTSYFVDVDFDNDGQKDKTIALVDNVKYVSNSRQDNLAKIQNGSKIVFEANVSTHLDMVNAEIISDGQVISTKWPKIVVDDVYGNSAVGLIDNVVAVDGELIGNAKRETNRDYLDYLDTTGYNEHYEPKDSHIENKVFEAFYNSNLRAR
ncbi:MAG: hypothetical protein K6F04_01570 [bacterium]|nr:hypothetical protein [bacterium]